MNLYCVQPEIAWHDAAKNRQRFETMIRNAQPQQGSLVVLPETAFSGFSGDLTNAAESAEQPNLAWASGLAGELNINLAIGLVNVDRDGRGLNQAILVGPDGEIGRYTKRNPFVLGEEGNTFAPGTSTRVFEIDGVRVCPLICYDLRFPEPFREGAIDGVDVFVLIANWPAARMHHWHALLRARAIENQAFVVGVNRAGSDPNVQYAGGSVVYDFDGRALLSMDERPAVAATTLDLEGLRNFRHKLPFLQDFRQRFGTRAGDEGDSLRRFEARQPVGT